MNEMGSVRIRDAASLRELVGRLASPVASKVMLERGGVHRVELPSLLEQLQRAVRSSMRDATGISGGGGGSMRGAATGSLLDSRAFDEVMYIRRTLAGWRGRCGLGHSEALSEALCEWAEAAIRLDAWGEGEWAELESWAAKIPRILAPPRRIELAGACVICGAESFPGSSGEMLPHPIVVEYPRDMADLDEAHAFCRVPGCGWEWHGESELRALRFQMA